MKTINYTGSSKLISRIVHLLNRKAPLPLDGDGDAVWGTNGQVLTTDGNGNTSWTTPQGGGGDVTDVEVNGTSVVNAQGVAEVTVPTKTSDLNNDSSFITNLVNDLANYYTKSQTYTQAEVNQLISGIVTLNILVVQTLPTQDISTTTIYLVPKQDTGTSDIYDEYLYINNAWELIGTTQIDLSNYVTTTDLSTALADYVTSVGLATILADYVQSSDLGNGTITIQKNGSTVDSFTTNQSANKTVNITVTEGHTIWNRIKTALTARGKLWFADASVSDVSADDATKVEVVTELASETAFDNLATDGTADGVYCFPDSGEEYLTADMVGYGSGTVKDALLQLFGTGAGSANSRCYREEITSITADMWSSIADGTFSKVHVGMHYTAPSGRTYWFADMDYFFGGGDTEQTNHHILVIEDEINHTAAHHTSNTTTGGTASSDIYTATLPAYQSELEADFGAAHILEARLLLSNAVTSGAPSGFAWTGKYSFLLNTPMVFGHYMQYTGNTSEIYNGGNRLRQLALFQAMPETIISRLASTQARQWCWTDDVAGSNYFGAMTVEGLAFPNGASGVLGVRRAFIIG